MENTIAGDRLRLPSFDCPNPYCTAKNIAFAPNAESKNRSELIPIEALEEIDDAEFIVNCPKCRRQFALIRHHSYAWTIAQVKSILHNETYIGNSVHNTQSTISYKNKRVVRKPKEDWFRVENTHEPLISKSDFEQVQEQTKSRRRQKADSTTQIFAGLVRCADCGWSMSYGTNKTSSNPFSYFNCTNYRQFGKKAGTCTAHYIRYDVLYQYVLTRIRHWAKEAHTDEEKLLENILKAGDR